MKATSASLRQLFYTHHIDVDRSSYRWMLDRMNQRHWRQRDYDGLLQEFVDEFGLDILKTAMKGSKWEI